MFVGFVVCYFYVNGDRVNWRILICDQIIRVRFVRLESSGSVDKERTVMYNLRTLSAVFPLFCVILGVRQTLR